MYGTPTPPQPHFPSPYARPSMMPAAAHRVRMRNDYDALIATFIYAPHGMRSYLNDTWRLPVLMLHGNGEEHGIFGPTIDAVVAAGHAVIAIDSRGQGKSTRGRQPLTYELLAQDALEVLDDLEVNRVHVLGFSDGGIEALLLARDHPERVVSLMAMGANLTPEGVIPETDWDLPALIAQNRAWAKYLSRWDGYVHDRVLDHNGIGSNLLTPTSYEAEATADLLQLMLDEPHIEAASLAAIACPATIMVGEFDCIVDYETCAIVEAIAGSRLVVVPGAGHTLPKHAPDVVTRELLATMAQAETSEGAAMADPHTTPSDER